MAPLKLPTFIVAGVPNAGTTAVHHILRGHPQVFMSPVKEPTYFAAADMLAREDFSRIIRRDSAALQTYLAGEQDPHARYWITDWDDYVRLYRDVREQRAIGESSVGYFWLTGAAAAIRSRIPDVRLVFILREPAERLFSWYLFSLRDNPSPTFRQWFLNGGSDTMDGGRTGTHLQRFVDLFPRSQVRFYLYESLRDDPARLFGDLFSYLGVEQRPIALHSRHNETWVRRFPRFERVRQWLLGSTSLTGWLPTGVRGAVHRITRRTRNAFAMSTEDRRLVVDNLGSEIEHTARLTGYDLSRWLR